MSDNPFIPNYDDPPDPPSVVYKYVAPERLDVLRNGCIRFTPLLATNDPFEIRRTFERIAGPKFRAALEHEANTFEPDDIDSMIAEELKKLGLSGQAASSLGPVIARAALGNDYIGAIREQTKRFATKVIDGLNTGESVEGMLDRLGGSMLALSLAERADSTPMWAHYAQSSAGFVIAFNASDPFFNEGKDGKKRILHKIAYFDRRYDELMDDPRACLISKTSEWSYEHEWRLYVKVEDADKTIKNEEEEIHLLAFPASAICRVIAGSRAKSEFVSSLEGVMAERYPHASITAMRADRNSGRLIEEKLNWIRPGRDPLPEDPFSCHHRPELRHVTVLTRVSTARRISVSRSSPAATASTPMPGAPSQ